MKTDFDTIIVGGGLVGAAVACGITTKGNSVAVLDGGDGDFRASRGNFGLVWVQGKGAKHAPYAKWSGTEVLSFRQSNIDYQPGASVWYLDKERCAGVLVNAVNYNLTADKIVIAVGAQERPMPIPGWQLPGVMSAGAGIQ